jgi:hypothetical protein
MQRTRRGFCASSAVAVLSLLPGIASGQDGIALDGHLRSVAGADVDGTVLRLSKVDGDGAAETTVDSSGEIDVTVPWPGIYRFTAIGTSKQRDRVPAVYAFENVSVSTEPGFAEFTVPEAHLVTIRCVDPDGNPIENLAVNFRAENGYGLSPGTFTTDAEGYVKYFGATERGVELAGRTGIELQPPTKPDRVEPLDSVSVSEPLDLEFTVSNPDPYKRNYRVIEADPDAGFHLPYLLYVPDSDGDVARPLYVQPHNDLPVETRAELINQLATAALGPAVELGFPAIVPGFPRTPNDGPDYIQSLALPSYRPGEFDNDRYDLEGIATEEFTAEMLTRIDEQLLAMIDDARSRLASEDYSLADRVHMNGFSSSTTFSHRFAFLYPERVRTITTGGSAVLPVPTDSIDGTTLPYPLGTADYETLTGRSFDEQTWADIDRYIYVGREDQPLPSTDERSYYPGSGRYRDRVPPVYGKNRVTERFPFVESQYEPAGVDATFEIYDGVGHRTTDETRRAVVQFHQDNAPQSPPTAPSNPRERVLQITGKSGPEALTQTDVSSVITLFNRGATRNGVAVTQTDVTSIVTMFNRAN